MGNYFEHKHREALYCFLLNEYGVSDFYVRTGFPPEVILANQKALLNLTWFVEYSNDWIFYGSANTVGY